MFAPRKSSPCDFFCFVGVLLTVLWQGACDTGPAYDDMSRQGAQPYGTRILTPMNEGILNPTDYPHIAVIAKAISPDAVLVHAAGTSMLPFAGPNDVFIVVPTKWEDLTHSEVVVYKDSKGRLIAHRLIRPEGDGWIVKGDNNTDIDAELVTRDNLVGVVSTVTNTTQHFDPN